MKPASERRVETGGSSGATACSTDTWARLWFLAVFVLLSFSWLQLTAEASEGENVTDRLWLRQGDPWVGHLVNSSLELQTPYARLRVPVSAISDVRLGEGSSQLDRVTTRSGDRMSGLIADPEIVFDPQSGPRLTVRRDQVSRIALQPSNSPATSQGDRSTQLIFFRNGDMVSGRILGGPFRLSTPQTDVILAVENLVSVVFSDTHPVLAEVRTGPSEKLEGVWPDRELEIALDVGPIIRVYPSRVSSIDEAGEGQDGGPGGTSRVNPSEASDGSHSLTNELDLVWIPPGAFVMGSPSEESDRDLDEGPQTRVQITRGFWISRCEVTQAQYREIMGTNPSLFVGDLRRPVEKVRYRDALEFCARLTQQHLAEGQLPADCAYRLPTEAEWEYACRAGTETRFSFGDDLRGYELEGYAWFNGNSDSSTQPVGTRKPNAWGLHDMHGNVLEWCLDGATSTLPGGDVQDPLTPAEGILRIARGGSWLYGAKACRSANRDSYGESTRSSDLGFRFVLAVSR